MAGQRQLPNLGLTNRWAIGMSGWGDDMNGDMARLDALAFLTVGSLTMTAPPASPAEGDRYIVAGPATAAWAGHEASIALYLDASWTFYTPKAGWRAHDNATGSDYRYTGTAWAKIEQPYDIAAYVPSFGAVLTDPVFSLSIRRPTRFPAGLAGSAASARVAAAAAATLPIQRNGTAIGSVNFAAGATAGTFTFATETVFAVDDLFEVYPTNDTALKGVRLSFVGFR